MLSSKYPYMPRIGLGDEPELLLKAPSALLSVLYNNGKRSLPRLLEYGGGVYEWRS